MHGEFADVRLLFGFLDKRADRQTDRQTRLITIFHNPPGGEVTNPGRKQKLVEGGERPPISLSKQCVGAAAAAAAAGSWCIQ